MLCFPETRFAAGGFAVVAALAINVRASLARFLGIASLHRFKNPFVMNLAAIGPPGTRKMRRRCSRSNPTMESSRERMSGFAAALCQRQMKIQISFDIRVRILSERDP